MSNITKTTKVLLERRAPVANKGGKRVATVLFKLTPAQSEFLRVFPRNSLAQFTKGSAGITDWENIAFRMHVGVFLSKEIYTAEVALQMSDLLSALISVRDRSMGSPDGIWTATEVELSMMLSSLDAVDTMQEECTRVQQLAAYKLADAAVGNLLKSVKRDLL